MARPIDFGPIQSLGQQALQYGHMITTEKLAKDRLAIEQDVNRRAGEQFEQQKQLFPAQLKAAEMGNLQTEIALKQKQRAEQTEAQKFELQNRPIPVDQVFKGLSQNFPTLFQKNLELADMLGLTDEQEIGGQKIKTITPLKQQMLMEWKQTEPMSIKQDIDAMFQDLGVKKASLMQEATALMQKGDDKSRARLQEIQGAITGLEAQQNSLLSADKKLMEQISVVQAKANADVAKTRAEEEIKQPGREKIANIGAQSRLDAAAIRATGTEGKAPTQHQMNTATTNLRKEFNNRPEVKEFNTIMPKFAGLDKALAEAKTTKNKVAADQALITLFNKMTDPQSVVRESEYARTPENLALINRIKGKIAKIAEGGAGLTDSDRDAIVNMAKQFKIAYQDVFNTVAEEYAGYAKGMNIEPEMIIGKKRVTQPAPAQGGYSQADLEFTAKKYGLTVEQVKEKLGVK